MSQLCIFIMSGLNFERFWNLALISDVVDHQGNFPKGQATKINAIQNKVNSDIQPVFTLLRLRLFIEIWFWQDFSNVDITHHKFQTVRHALYIYQRKSPEGRLEKWLFYKHYKIGLSFLNADSCTWCCSLMDCVNYSEVTTILTTVSTYVWWLESYLRDAFILTAGNRGGELFLCQGTIWIFITWFEGHTKLSA